MIKLSIRISLTRDFSSKGLENVPLELGSEVSGLVDCAVRKKIIVVRGGVGAIVVEGGKSLVKNFGSRFSIGR